MSIAQIYDQMKTDIAQEIGTTSHNDLMEVTESGNWITSEDTTYKVTVCTITTTRCYYGFIGI